ncbi:hypothetical protein N7451_006710 [Penicillium sp. IBT 35674x]|nr:hypothetical protein N7451_006710 [Penicillium sp. IBT 35674x]
MDLQAPHNDNFISFIKASQVTALLSLHAHGYDGHTPKGDCMAWRPSINRSYEAVSLKDRFHAGVEDVYLVPVDHAEQTLELLGPL